MVNSHSAQLPPGIRRGLTREDCRALQAAGLLELEKFELIDGELISRTGKSPLHSVVLHHFCNGFAKSLALNMCNRGFRLTLVRY